MWCEPQFAVNVQTNARLFGAPPALLSRPGGHIGEAPAGEHRCNSSELALNGSRGHAQHLGPIATEISVIGNNCVYCELATRLFSLIWGRFCVFTRRLVSSAKFWPTFKARLVLTLASKEGSRIKDRSIGQYSYYYPLPVSYFRRVICLCNVFAHVLFFKVSASKLLQTYKMFLDILS